jgi:hypothetical protein
MEDLNVDRVITQEDTRLYDVEGVVFELNASNIIFNNPVKLVGDDGNAIGYVTLYFDSGKVRAKAYFDYCTPERLNLENGEAMYLMATRPRIVVDVGDSVVLTGQKQRHPPLDGRVSNED